MTRYGGSLSKSFLQDLILIVLTDYHDSGMELIKKFKKRFKIQINGGKLQELNINLYYDIE